MEDVPRWHRLVEVVTEADDGAEHLSVDDMHDELAPWVDLSRDTVLGVDDDGVARAFGLVQIRPADVTLLRAHCWGGVDPTWRGRGVGRALITWQLDRAEALVAGRRAALGDAEVPAAAYISVDVERVPTAARLVERLGMQPVRWFSDMRRDLSLPLPPLEVPPGLRIEPFAPEFDEPLRLAHNEAFTDHWGFQPWDVETWRQWSTGHRSFRPDWTFIAFDGAEIAGYAVSAAYETDWAALGYTQGWTAKLGVRPPWRGRGLGRALLIRSLQAFAADGMQYAGLDVDSENPSGAVALYTGVGYEVERRSASYQRRF